MSDTETKDQTGEKLEDVKEHAPADVIGAELETPKEPSEMDLAAKAAFARIGIELDAENGSRPEVLIDGLNAAADNTERLTAELATVSEERDALVAKFKEIENAPKAKAVKAPKPREIAPLKDAFSTDDLLELVKGAKRVEVAFSNGKTEIAHLPAQVIEGDAWRVGVNGLRLEGVTLSASGPASLAGYGLFLDGKLAAYRARSDVLEITSGHTMRLAGDVVF
ncbi:hypothetical protein [Novosphingobium sp.]|uniref:hypothetical protein n=1 Tax=Novosphingobium sp. TaxID=1874826 RepID=UPI00286DFE9E|nr:hypothetical protein [Novosphingobium sp.]